MTKRIPQPSEPSGEGGCGGRHFRGLLYSGESKATNECVVKELRRVLSRRGFSLVDVDFFVSDIKKRCRILKTPSAFRFTQLRLKDKSDVPVVLGALDANAVLVTLDRALAKEASAFVEVRLLDY